MAGLNINKDIDNSVLNELLAQRRTMDKNDRNTVNELSERLATEIVMKAALLGLVNFSKEPVKDKNGELSIEKGTNMNFMLVDSQKQGKYFPVFTDRQAIEKWGGVQNYYTVQVGFENLAGLILTGDTCNGIVLNVGTDNLIIDRNVLASWNERKQISEKGHAENVITNNTPLEIYAPNPYPLQLSNRLCETAKEISEVKNLWLRGITLNGEAGYLLVVDFSGDRHPIFAKLGEAGKTFLGKMPLHLVPFNDQFGKNAVEKVMPIYSKE